MVGHQIIMLIQTDNRNLQIKLAILITGLIFLAARTHKMIKWTYRGNLRILVMLVCFLKVWTRTFRKNSKEKSLQEDSNCNRTSTYELFGPPPPPPPVVVVPNGLYSDNRSPTGNIQNSNCIQEMGKLRSNCGLMSATNQVLLVNTSWS